MLVSSRYFLRKLVRSDASIEYLTWLKSDSSKDFISYFNSELNLNDIENYIIKKNCLTDVLFLGIFDKFNSKHIGNIKFEPIDIVNKYTIMGVLIGDPEYKGIGTVPEVLNLTINFLKKTYDINTVLLGVSKLNNAAIRAYLKSGFIEISDSPFLLKDSSNSVIMKKVI